MIRQAVPAQKDDTRKWRKHAQRKFVCIRAAVWCFVIHIRISVLSVSVMFGQSLLMRGLVCTVELLSPFTRSSVEQVCALNLLKLQSALESNPHAHLAETVVREDKLMSTLRLEICKVMGGVASLSTHSLSKH